MNKAIIGLGSNINPQVHIEKARTIIAKRFRVLGESNFVTTKPVGFLEQADFINGAVLIETDQNFNQMLTSLKNIEDEMGREKSVIKFGPRKIDLDVLVWNGQITDKDFYNRDFIKNAVLALIPELEH